ncbi:MAG: HlyD family efflux transporter periplasmic adaptor subunit [Anaerolineales bacterium]|nr:HlyD family efflux transporter periplasmic adaptor subunit [Anaerolineales bacterium]
MNKKYFLAILMLIFLVGCARSAEFTVGNEMGTAVSDPNITPTPRPTTPPPSSSTVLADGQIVAVHPMLTLGFAANGRLLSVHVQPGDTVQAGDLIASLDDSVLQEAITNAELAVAQAENSLAQAQLSLDDLLNWEPDETAVALAQANVAAAQAALEQAQTSDAAAGNSLTSARVNLDQAERNLADAQEAYDTAFDPGREWEFGVPGYKERLENERDGATRNLQYAQENLEVARAQYNLAVAGLNNDSAVSAEASLLNAQQTLTQTLTGPKQSEIATAQLHVEQADLSLQQSQFSLQQAQDALVDAQLLAPWAGTIVSVEASPGAAVNAGTPIVTLLDTDSLQFHTSNLSERDLAQVQPGQPVEIVLKSYSGQPISGHVARIAPQAAGTVGDAAVFTVMIALDPTDLDLRPGMTGRIEISSE